MYVGNNPVNYVDPTGHWAESLLDFAGIYFSARDLIKNPSWANAGWLLLDVGGAILPGAVAPGAIRHADDVVELGTKTFSKVVSVFDKLPSSVADSFADGSYTKRVLDEPMEVYRVEGGTSGTYGRFYGTVKPETAAHGEQMYNIYMWGNELTDVSTYRVPAGTTIYEGPVAGGTGIQWYIPDPKGVGVQLQGTEYLPPPGY